ncbi:MAG: acetolactate decarboxylase [Nonlabens sp.]
MRNTLLLITMASFIISCQTKTKEPSNITYPDVKISGAMSNVIWKGELGGTIAIDTITNQKGLYGLGPESYLTGEILINDGISYVSRVLTDSTMMVKRNQNISAPLLVYANVNEWNPIQIDTSISTVQDLENLVDELTKDFKRPFAFKLKGEVLSANFHIQNLPDGSTVNSPAQAHIGQTNYQLTNQQVTIVGFFSTEHAGVFTHHDSNVHLHLITDDEQQMGHLDKVTLGKMILFLPVK